MNRGILRSCSEVSGVVGSGGGLVPARVCFLLRLIERIPVTRLS